MTIEELENLIKKCDDMYYNHSTSLISDFEYDKYKKELEKIKGEQGVGSKPNSKFIKTKHTSPMLSLNNSYNIDDVYTFIDKVEKIKSSPEISVEMKLDGLSISVKYVEGKLTQAITRGDGIIGEDVTENVKQISNIPLILNDPLTIEIRGEIILPIKEFKRLNEERLKSNEPLFANPRNAASGTLRQLNPMIVKERKLEVYFYHIVTEMSNIDSQSKVFKLFQEQGIPFGEYVITKKENIKSIIDKLKIYKEKLPYETDGLVLKVNDFNIRKELSETSKAPRWAVAYKFEPKQITTKLLNVTWQVGRTGKITPVAELEEVELAGSKIKRASLHNYDEICRKDVRIGDRVFIEKAAEIIPQIVSVVKEVRTGNEIKIKEPLYCPICNERLISFEGEVDTYCNNPECKGRLQGILEHFVSRDGMNIQGLGPNIISLFISLGYLNSIPDIYYLYKYRNELIKLEGFGEKSVDKLLENIELSKENNIQKIIYALGIPFVGNTLSKKISTLITSIDDLLNIDKDTILSWKLGENTSIAIYVHLVSPIFKNLVLKLKECGVKFNSISENKTLSNKLNNHTFLVTGTLKEYTRKEIEDIIILNGGKLLSSVNKNLNYLIIGDNAGSKLTKAKDISSIKIISEDEFKNMINV